MRTHNETLVRAPLAACLLTAADVERWPELLPHYRYVRFQRKDGFGAGRVEMAAYRHFGPLPYPVWWESEMRSDPEAGVVRYRHVEGITRGMDVAWTLEARPEGTRIVIVHEWEGPGWPLLGGFAARRVIGPHFIHAVAGRTLEGIRRHLEGRTARDRREEPGSGRSKAAGRGREVGRDRRGGAGRGRPEEPPRA